MYNKVAVARIQSLMHLVKAGEECFYILCQIIRNLFFELSLVFLDRSDYLLGFCFGKQQLFVNKLGFFLFIGYFFDNCNGSPSSPYVIESGDEFSGEQHPVPCRFQCRMNGGVGCVSNGEGHACHRHHSVNRAVVQRNDLVPVNSFESVMCFKLQSKMYDKIPQPYQKLIENHRNRLFSDILVNRYLMAQVEFLFCVKIVEIFRKSCVLQTRKSRNFVEQRQHNSRNAHSSSSGTL